MSSVLIRSPYDGKRVRVTIDCGEGVTKQSFKDECDIHNILRQYARTGLLNHVNTRPPMFVDVANMPDYRTALQNVRDAEDLFMQLPSKTRQRFENDPGVFLDFCNNPENEGELRELGLLPPDTIPGEVEAPQAATPQPGGQAPEGGAADPPVEAGGEQ